MLVRVTPGVTGDVITLHVVAVHMVAGAHRFCDRANGHTVLEHFVAGLKRLAGHLVPYLHRRGGVHHGLIDYQCIAGLNGPDANQNGVIRVQQQGMNGRGLCSRRLVIRNHGDHRQK